MAALVWKFVLGRLAAVLAFIGLRAFWIGEGRKKQEQARAAQNVQAIRNAVEVENEVEALDRDTLKRRAAKWVRGPSR